MPTTLLIVAAVAILIILLATASYKVCPADRVMVITGPGGRRFVSGGSAFIIPFIMRVDWLSLGAVQSLLRTDTPIPTKDAILIDVNAVANFQIASETMTEAIVETSRHKPNPINWKHVVSNCDERWNLIKGNVCLAVLSGNWDVFENRYENRIMLVTRKGTRIL